MVVKRRAVPIATCDPMPEAQKAVSLYTPPKVVRRVGYIIRHYCGLKGNVLFVCGTYTTSAVACQTISLAGLGNLFGVKGVLAQEDGDP